MNAHLHLVTRIMRKVATIKDDDQKQREYIKLHIDTFGSEALEEAEASSASLHSDIQHLNDTAYLLACSGDQLLHYDRLTNEMEKSMYRTIVRLIRLRTRDTTRWVPERVTYKPHNPRKNYQTPLILQFGSDSYSPSSG